MLSGTGTMFRAAVLREVARERGKRLPGRPFEPAEELSYKQVKAFGVAVGRQPDIVLAYA